MKHSQNIQYGMVDVVKFLCAILIVIGHYVTENAWHGRVNVLLEYGVSIFIIVVPFFFCCAGYFLFGKILNNPKNGKNYLYSYCKRIAIMYGGWSLIYFFFVVMTWVRFGTTKKDVVLYFVNALFYSTYNTIWFLPALCIGSLMTYVVIEHLGFKKASLIAVAFYLIGTIGVSYSFLLEKNEFLSTLLKNYNLIFVSTRNGFFNGFPYIFLGAYIAKKKSEKNKTASIGKFFALCVFWGCCFVIEAVVLKFGFNSVNTHTLLFLVPFTYCFVNLCLLIPFRTNKTLKWLRQMSTAIFLCQRIYLSALPGLFPKSLFSTMLSGNPYIGLTYILTITVVTAALLIGLGKKNRWISAIC